MKNDIEALKGFVIAVLEYTDSDVIKHLAVDFGMYSDNGYSEILTGSKDTIKDRQRKENFAIINDILKSGLEEFRGWTKEDVHSYLKSVFLVPIFLEDDSEFREHWALIDRINKNVSISLNDAANIKKSYLSNISITDCDKDQAERYLRDIKQFCVEHGVRLSAPKYYENY